MSTLSSHVSAHKPRAVEGSEIRYGESEVVTPRLGMKTPVEDSVNERERDKRNEKRENERERGKEQDYMKFGKAQLFWPYSSELQSESQRCFCV